MFSPEDFSAMTLKSILGEKSMKNNEDSDEYAELPNNDMSFEDSRIAASSFTIDEKERLISRVGE